MSSDNALNRLRLAYVKLDGWDSITLDDVIKIRQAIHNAVAAWQIDKEDMRRLSRRVTLLEAQVREMSADTGDRK
jgi:hypothetical protein